MKLCRLVASLGVLFVAVSTGWAADRPHNIVLFVADGLRGGIVNDETAPAMTACAMDTPLPERTVGSQLVRNSVQ